MAKKKATKPAASKGPAKKSAKQKPARTKSAKQAPQKPKAMRKLPGQKHALQRADYGQPVDAFFAKQPSPQREILAALRQAIEQAAPDATSALKWGQPVYSLGGAMWCALGSHKSHVNLILVGSPERFADPDRRLTGEGKGGRHLRLTSLADLPAAAVLRGWLQVAIQHARQK